MSKAMAWLVRLAWFVPPVVLAFAAVPRLVSGMAAEAAFPVPIYMIMNYPLPRSAYLQAAKILGAADRDDGEAMIARAEAMSRTGESPEQVMPVLRLGLSRAPASARGWILLGEQEGQGDRRRAGAALSLALTLGPYDYWLAGRRARDAARLWEALDPDGQAEAFDQLRLLWEEPLLRDEIEPLLRLKDGPALMTRALAGEPNEVRALNLWLGERRRKSLRRG